MGIAPTVAAIQSAIDNASPDAIIQVDGGTPTWNTTLIMSKGVRIQGPGRSALTITAAAGRTTPIIRMAPSNYADTTNLYRFDGATFNGGGGNMIFSIGHDAAQFNPTVDTPALPKFRITDCRFTNSTDYNESAVARWWGSMAGVIDNCTIDNWAGLFRVDTNGYPFGYSGTPIENRYDHMWPFWGMGSDQVFCVEDCDISGMDWGNDSQLIDSQYGIQGYVFRYNNITPRRWSSGLLEMHGPSWFGTVPGVWGSEIYGNYFRAYGGGDAGIIHKSRGGTGRVFCNSGAGGELVVFYVDNPTTIGPCPTLYPTEQLHREYYTFLNRAGYTGSVWPSLADVQNPNVCWGLTNRPTRGREFFDDTSSPAVTAGPLASRPASPSLGQAYWATNQSVTNLTGMVGVNPATPISGTLYICRQAGSWSPSTYTPLAYPHPYREEGEILMPPTLDIVFSSR